MKMDSGLDTGPVYASEVVPIGATTTAGDLHDDLAVRGARLLITVIDRIVTGQLNPTPQPARGASYAEKIRKPEARIDWRKSAVEIDRKIRAFNPWPIAETQLSDGRRLRIFECEIVRDAGSDRPGRVLRADAAGLVVATGDGAISLKTIQAPSGRAISAAAYLAARPLDGARFVN